jgi:hypothetical protein
VIVSVIAAKVNLTPVIFKVVKVNEYFIKRKFEV